MIEFLTNNIIWVIVGIIIIVMAIIGYFAENSELGKKIMKPKPKVKVPETKEKPEKPQTIEDAMKQIDKNKGLASVIGEEKDETAVNTENIVTEGIYQSIPVDDAWSNNVDTDTQKPQEVVETNPDEWLNAPIDLPAETKSDVVSNTEENTSNDYLYDLPSSDDISEVSISELPSDDFDDIEVLDVSDDFDDVEVLNIEDSDEVTGDSTENFENPVEETLAQLDNSNQALENELQNIEDDESDENSSENDDIWK